MARLKYAGFRNDISIKISSAGTDIAQRTTHEHEREQQPLDPPPASLGVLPIPAYTTGRLFPSQFAMQAP
jgi:hypothetical protein